MSFVFNKKNQSLKNVHIYEIAQRRHIENINFSVVYVFVLRVIVMKCNTECSEFS